MRYKTEAVTELGWLKAWENNISWEVFKDSRNNWVELNTAWKGLHKACLFKCRFTTITDLFFLFENVHCEACTHCTSSGGAYKWQVCMHNKNQECITVSCHVFVYRACTRLFTLCLCLCWTFESGADWTVLVNNAGLNERTAKLVTVCTREASVSIGMCNSILPKLKIWMKSADRNLFRVRHLIALS